ncbi:hypothetical protein YDYSG_04250 [Paenibacillus tyrfis]|nr:hypothetical protein YDYSG_04250 [Paenibacillus tyrfis]
MQLIRQWYCSRYPETVIKISSGTGKLIIPSTKALKMPIILDNNRRRFAKWLEALALTLGPPLLLSNVVI